jgi:hypothetical protein
MRSLILAAILAGGPLTAQGVSNAIGVMPCNEAYLSGDPDIDTEVFSYFNGIGLAVSFLSLSDATPEAITERTIKTTIAIMKECGESPPGSTIEMNALTVLDRIRTAMMQ